jgi:dephospho-CoA kinase
MNKSSLSIGLTGGIGSGKTLICRVFESLGVPVFISDIEAKRCYDDMDFVRLVAKEISPTIIVDDKFQKKVLAKIVFSNNTLLKKLNKLVHPVVLNMYDRWLEQQDYPYVILESAIILEIGWQQHFDKIIGVDTPMEVAIERVVQRDNISREEVMQRIMTQKPSSKKSMLSDYVIYHDNSIMVLKQVLNIHEQILALAKKRTRQI